MNTDETPAPREPWKHVPKSAETRAKIAASMRGNANRRNGKRRPPETLKKAVPVYFPPAVLAALDAHLKHAPEKNVPALSLAPLPPRLESTQTAIPPPEPFPRFFKSDHLAKFPQGNKKTRSVLRAGFFAIKEQTGILKDCVIRLLILAVL